MLKPGDEIGRIVRLQVQKVAIKRRGEGYVPEDILAVDRAAVDAWGMMGWNGDHWVVDAHNKAHPSRRGGGRRQLSIGFTGHYALMRERFGNAPIGIAGENFVIDGPAVSLEDLGEGVIVVTSDGRELSLERPRVAAPCVEFTSFMLGLDHVAPLAAIAGPLRDLDDGRRGFIVSADHAAGPDRGPNRRYRPLRHARSLIRSASPDPAIGQAIRYGTPLSITRLSIAWFRASSNVHAEKTSYGSPLCWW